MNRDIILALAKTAVAKEGNDTRDRTLAIELGKHVLVLLEDLKIAYSDCSFAMDLAKKHEARANKYKQELDAALGKTPKVRVKRGRPRKAAGDVT